MFGLAALLFTILTHPKLLVSAAFTGLRALPLYCGWAADRILNEVWREFGTMFGLPSAAPPDKPTLATHLETVSNTSTPGYAISNQELQRLLSAVASQREASAPTPSLGIPWLALSGTFGAVLAAAAPWIRATFLGG